MSRLRIFNLHVVVMYIYMYITTMYYIYNTLAARIVHTKQFRVRGKGPEKAFRERVFFAPSILGYEL